MIVGENMHAVIMFERHIRIFRLFKSFAYAIDANPKKSQLVRIILIAAHFWISFVSFPKLIRRDFRHINSVVDVVYIHIVRAVIFISSEQLQYEIKCMEKRKERTTKHTNED